MPCLKIWSRLKNHPHLDSSEVKGSDRRCVAERSFDRMPAMKDYFLGAFVLLTGPAALGVGAQTKQPRIKGDIVPGAAWQTISPASVGFSTARLEALRVWVKADAWNPRKLPCGSVPYLLFRESRRITGIHRRSSNSRSLTALPCSTQVANPW